MRTATQINHLDGKSCNASCMWRAIPFTCRRPTTATTRIVAGASSPPPQLLTPPLQVLSAMEDASSSPASSLFPGAAHRAPLGSQASDNLRTGSCREVPRISIRQRRCPSSPTASHRCSTSAMRTCASSSASTSTARGGCNSEPPSSSPLSHKGRSEPCEMCTTATVRPGALAPRATRSSMSARKRGSNRERQRVAPSTRGRFTVNTGSHASC
mmetsp:Transcript_22159/g.76004  ORF Transcript_22159/g.76004 Transcript_22159/m.76004 type:complete len:213 (-) Transcript_22159:1599-2237(-)